MNSLLIGLLFILAADVCSDDGSFRALIQHRGGTELVTESITLCDRAGNVLYAKKDLAAHTFFIGNSGSVFAVSAERLDLYHPDGREVTLKELVYPNGFGFSPDNALFFASDREGIFTYSDRGVLAGTYCPGRLFASTARGGCVAVVSADTLYVYEKSALGDVELLASPYAWDVFFTGDDGEHIVVQYENLTQIYDRRTRGWVEPE